MKVPPAPRWLLRSVGAVALTGVFVTATTAGVVLHADLPVARRVLADTLSEVLSDYFVGTIEISNITEFDRRGITVERAAVYDSFQNRVLLLRDLKVRASLTGILEKLLSDEPKISLVIRHVRAERGDVNIIPHPKTEVPTIAEAFTPKSTEEGEPSARYIRVWLPTIEVGKAFGRGTVAGSPVLEADVREILGSVLVTPKGVAVDVSRFGLDLRGLGGADARGLGSLHVREPGAIWGNFDGHLGEVQLGAFVEYDKERLKTRLDLPQAVPEQVRAIWHDYPLHQELSGRLEAEGPIEELDLRANLSVGPAKVQAAGVIKTEKELNIDLEAHTHDFDLRAVLPDAPETSLEATAAVVVYSKDGKTTVEFNGFTEPGTVADIQVPAIDAYGTYDEMGLASRATVHEPGLPAKLSFDRTPEGIINLVLDARRFKLSHPRIRPYLDASGFAEGTVKATIQDHGELTASFEADLEALRYQDIALARGKLTGKAEGHINDLDHLSIAAHLTGSDFVRPGMDFESVEVRADGPVQQPRIEAKLANPDGQRIEARGKVSTGGAPRVDGLAMSVHHQGADLEVAAGEVEANAAGVRVQNLVVVQDGKELRGDVVVTRDLIKIQANGSDIDLDALSRTLGLAPGTLSGHLTVDADITSARDIEHGQIRFDIKDAHLGDFESVSAKGVVSLDEGRVDGTTEFEVGELGHFSVEFDGQLGGKARDLEAWKTMTGSSLVNVYAIDLAKLTRYLDPNWKIRDLRGLATARVRLQRQDGNLPPSAFLDAATRNLQVILEDDGDPSTIETIQGIDVQLGGAVDAPSGTTSGTVRLVDQYGTLISTSGTAHIDWTRLYADPKTAADVFSETNVETVFVVPPRPLQHLPVQLRVAGVEGEISGRVAMNGPIDGPTYNALIEVDKLQGTATSLTRPVRLAARANYAAPSGRLGGSVEAHQHTERVLWGSFQGTLNDESVDADETKPLVTGSARFQVEALPLELLQPLSRAEMRGRVNGTVAISREREQPDLNIDLELEGGSIQGIPLGPGELSMRSSSGDVLATARFGDARESMRAEVRTRADWSDSGLRIRDAVTLDLKSNRYDSVILLPFVDELFTELNGPLDADVRVVLKPPKESEDAQADSKPDHWEASFAGHARLRGGELEPVDLGLKLTDADVNLVADREGKYNVVELTSINASARSDEKNLHGNGKLYFEGIRLSHGWASIGAKKVPFVVQGVRLADVTGQVGTSFRASEDRMSARVNLPSLHVELPRSSGRELIELGENDDIIVAQPLGPPGEDEEPGLPWHIDFHLGNDVRVRSNALNLRLTGNPKMIIGEKVDVSGKLYLPDGGRVLVAGKLFVIEHGFIQFDTEDFTNPHVSITSTWRTPSGILITAYLRGTVHEPQLTLESDPALPGGEDEIYALLFGGGSGQEGASSADPALAAGAAMLSSVLDNTELQGVELRAGEEKRSGSGQLSTISEGSLKSYAAAVQVSDKVWFEGTYKSESGTLGSEGHSGFGGTVDWRFKEDWALRTELGELGAGVDLLWRYRY